MFFKQKTAYEVRIRDWSSDVCSSDFADVQFQVVELVAVLGDQADAGIGPAGVGAVVLDELALFDALRGENFLAQAVGDAKAAVVGEQRQPFCGALDKLGHLPDRKSTRLNSSH